MSPRKSRKGIKAEKSDEKLVESEFINSLNMPDEGRRTLRTRRQTKLKNNNDSDIDISLHLNKSKQSMKKTRARKVVPENVDALVNSIGLSSKKRYKRDTNATVLEDSVVSDQSQVTDVLSTTKSTTTRGRRWGGRKQLHMNVNNDDEENENNENIVDKNSKNILSDNDGISSEDSEVATASTRNKKASATASSVRFIQLRNRNVHSPNPIVTPESSPITINLTPHRTTKTPRKSPINIGSPKTHTQTPQRVSKTPRKLPVEADSSILSDHSSIDDPLLEKGVSPNKSMKKKKSPKNSPTSVKSAKAQLKSPCVVSTKAKKSPVKSPSPKPKSPSKKSTSQESNESDKFPKLVLQRISVPETQESSENANDNFSEPKRTSPYEELKKQSKLCGIKNYLAPLIAEKTNFDIVASTPREKARQSLSFSPNLSSSAKRNPLKVESFYGISPRISSTRIQHEISNLQNITSPLISDDESLDISGVKPVTNNESILAANAEITDDETENKDDTYELSEPQTPGLKKHNDTYELDEPKTPLLKKKKKQMDAEILSNDLKVGEENDEVEIPQKRVCRVRFASPPMNSPVFKEKSSMRSSRSATPGNKTKRPTFITKRSPTKISRTSLIDKKHSPEKKFSRKRSSSVSSNELKPNSVASKKRSLSSVDVNRRSISKTLQDSVNRLSKPRSSINMDKKPEIKPTSAKKIPNFAEIHQKRFAQMESLVDAKKRVEERHHAFMNNISASHSKVEIESVKTNTETIKKLAPNPKDVSNGVYNRYGFKVRKEEATKILTKQVPTKNIEDTRIQKRMALKGVRSNRRFEMLMQMRNMKH